MSVGLNEISIGPGESPHGVGLAKSPKKIMVVGQTPVTFASRLEELHKPTMGLATQKIVPVPVKPTLAVSTLTSTPVASETTPAIHGLDDRTLPSADMSVSCSGNNVMSPKQPDNLLSISTKTDSAVIPSISGLTAGVSTILKRSTVDIRLTPKHSEPAKQPSVHALGVVHKVLQPTVISTEITVSPLNLSFDANQLPPCLPESKPTNNSIVPVNSGTKGKMAKEPTSTSGRTPDLAMGASGIALQHPVVSVAVMVSEDGKQGTATQDLSLAKTTVIEGTSTNVSVAQISPVNLVGGVSPLPIKLLVHASNISSLEIPIQQHRVEPNTTSLENAVYSGEGVNHSVLQTSSSALEVGLSHGTHGWVKIRAELDDGGLVHATLSARSMSGQAMLHRELPGLTRFLEMEHVAVQPFVAERSLTTGLDSGQCSNGSAADTQSGPKDQGGALSGFGDPLTSGSDGAEQDNTLTGGRTDAGLLLRSSGSGSWLNVRV